MDGLKPLNIFVLIRAMRLHVQNGKIAPPAVRFMQHVYVAPVILSRIKG